MEDKTSVLLAAINFESESRVAEAALLALEVAIPWHLGLAL